MKLFNRSLIAAAIFSTLTITSCMDEVYDPNKEPQTPPKENPLGEGVVAPDGFDWSMINSVKLNVEVKDEFTGQYHYLIEVFTGNPLSDETITPIAAGVAKQGQNFTTEITISKTINRIYIRQTDPKQRKEVREFVVPENGGDLSCKLYYTGESATKAMTRAYGGGNSGWDVVKSLEYTQTQVTVPETSAKLNNGNQLNAGDVYVIRKGETLKKDIHSYNGKATVIVEGEWKMQGGGVQGLDIYVMKDGDLSGNVFIGDNSTLEVQAGGEVDNDDKKSSFRTATNVTVKNFGEFDIEQVSDLNTGTVFYNGKGGTVEVEGDFNYKTSQIHNRGRIILGDDNNGNNGNKYNFESNNTTECVIANYEGATIKAHGIIGGLTLVNSGLIEVNNITNNSADMMYNNCTIIVNKDLTFRNIVLDRGSITGGRVSPNSNEWTPVQKVETLTDSKITMKNGSIIRADQFMVNTGDVIFKATNTSGNDSPSLIKVTHNIHFKEASTVSLLGRNLIIDGKIQKENNRNFKVNESINTDFDESKYTIETCGGIFNEGNEGENPGNPDFPMDITDNTNYTFAFEDNWPAYGDFDMNDLVIVMTDKTITKQENGNITRVKFNLNLRAVGATKTLGAGIRFTKLAKGFQPANLTIGGSSASFEVGQNAPTLIFFSDAHYELWGSEISDDKRINTLPNGKLKENTKKYAIIMEIPAASGVKAEDLNINNIDLFAITAPATDKERRTEVHVAGFAPTELGNTKLFGKGNDDSSANGSKYYLSKENLAWAVVVPQEFSWPIESKKVIDVYENFRSWITSGGTNNPDWYTTNNGNVYSLTNLVPLNK